mmetsp:Transcript_20810/g.56151  ORF Transcript_20810/g.56151 Transcript_20810/m.56151 type:complete len:286 (+) Transcript_20810:1014-1871(+)
MRRSGRSRPAQGTCPRPRTRSSGSARTRPRRSALRRSLRPRTRRARPRRARTRRRRARPRTQKPRRTQHPRSTSPKLSPQGHSLQQSRHPPSPCQWREPPARRSPTCLRAGSGAWPRMGAPTSWITTPRALTGTHHPRRPLRLPRSGAGARREAALPLRQGAALPGARAIRCSSSWSSVSSEQTVRRRSRTREGTSRRRQRRSRQAPCTPPQLLCQSQSLMLQRRAWASLPGGSGGSRLTAAPTTWTTTRARRIGTARHTRRLARNANGWMTRRSATTMREFFDE